MAQSKMEADPIIICMICLDYPNEPVNCRHCSNFVCTHCIDNWFRENTNNIVVTCPTCRNAIHRNEFIKLNWLPEHLKRINDQTKELERMKLSECSQHAKQELCIYCSTCSKKICAQCISAMFDGKHIDHTHDRLDAAQQRLIKGLDEQEKNVQSDLDKWEKYIQNKTLIIDQILTLKNERLNELEEFQTKIKIEIESEARKFLKKFDDEQNALTAEIDECKTRHVTLKKTIESSNQIDLFVCEKELFQQILQRPKFPELDKIDLSDDTIGSLLSVPWRTGQFLVEQFSIKQRNNDPISSHQIRLDHNQYWTLIIYPNGKDLHTGVYISVMLQLNKGMTQSIDYNIIIELINQRHDDTSHNYVFKSIQSFKEGQVNGCDQFYELNKLSINGFIDTETDSIKFRFKLRPKSILEERKLLQWQIESFNKNEGNWDEQNKEMNKIKSELIQLQQDCKEANRIIEDQRSKIKDQRSKIEDQQNKIEQIERDNFELKRKLNRSNHDYRNELISKEDHRSNSDQTRTVIFGNKKRFRE